MSKPGENTIEIELEGRSWTMKPCYAAMSQINREIEGGIVEALRRVGSSDINALETVIAAGCQFTALGRKGLGEKIYNSGPQKLVEAAVNYLIILNNGGESPSDDEVRDSGNEPTQ